MTSAFRSAIWENMAEKEEMLVGYARVSTLDQDPQMQIEAMVRYGVPRENIRFEKASGKNMDRPVLSSLIKIMPPGSTMVVWKLDRLGRTLLGVLETTQEMEARGINLKSVQDAIDTSTPAGRFNFHILGAVAQLERDLIAERTKEGMRRKKEAGWKAGRQPIIQSSEKLLAEFQRIYDSGEYFGMTNKSVYEMMQKADPKKKFTMRTYVKWKHDGHPGAMLNEEPPLDLGDDK